MILEIAENQQKIKRKFGNKNIIIKAYLNI